MIDFTTATEVALSPAVTIPVIAALALVIVGQRQHAKSRLNKFRAKVEAAGLAMAARLIFAAEKEMTRRTELAVTSTFKALKALGWDKLARGELTVADLYRVDPKSTEEVLRDRFGADFATRFPNGELHEVRVDTGGDYDTPAADRGEDTSGVRDGGTVLRRGPGLRDGQRDTAKEFEGAGLGHRPFHSSAKSPRAG